jgi:hypothetical protein
MAFHFVLQCLSQQFTAVVTADCSRASIPRDQFSQQCFHIRVSQVSARFDREAVTGCFVLHGQATQRLRIMITVVHKIPGPDIVAS